MSCELPSRKIGIIGSGLIGRSWSMLFASVGYQVYLYDILPEQIEGALVDIKEQLENLEKNKLLRGKLSASQQYACIHGTINLAEAVKGATLVQECVPENLDLKRKVWKEVDNVATSNTIFSSSTSTFLPSLFSDHLTKKQNIIVSHPVNPPYYVPLVEIVPAPWTEEWVPKKTKAIMEEIGQSPVNLTREIPGFSLNRIQYAILNEVWHQVNDGIISVEDVDKVMSEGMGMRYAFLGPLETTHLNAEGFINYCERYSKTLRDVSLDMKPVPLFEGPGVSKINEVLEGDVPLDKLQERRNWRDLCLTRLSQLKRELNQKK